MSTVLPDRPVLNSLDPSIEGVDPPISRLAVLSFILGMFSLSAAASMSLIPVAVVAALLCIYVIWKLSVDTALGGLRLAQIGLFFAVLSSSWIFAATRIRDGFLYDHASQYAQQYLETLSRGAKYEAFELTLPEADRQITGTDILAYYKQLQSAPSIKQQLTAAPDAGAEMPPSEMMNTSRSKDKVTEFLASSATQEIMSHGRDSQWKLVRGAGISTTSGTTFKVSVVMVDSVQPMNKVQVHLTRALNAYVPESGKAPALWQIERTELVKE